MSSSVQCCCVHCVFPINPPNSQNSPLEIPIACRQLFALEFIRSSLLTMLHTKQSLKLVNRLKVRYLLQPCLRNILHERKSCFLWIARRPPTKSLELFIRVSFKETPISNQRDERSDWIETECLLHIDWNVIHNIIVWYAINFEGKPWQINHNENPLRNCWKNGKIAPNSPNRW